MIGRNNSSRKICLLVLYEAIILFLLIAALIPKEITFKQFITNPIGLLPVLQVNEKSIALALGLFLPLILPHIKSLKIFGTEVELRERVNGIEGDIRKVRRESAIRQYDQERVFYTTAASIRRSMETQLRREKKSFDEVPLEIGMKDFPESRILAEIIYCLFDTYNLSAKPPTMQQPTLGTFFNLRSGKIDLYVEYSGVGFMLAGIQAEEHTAKSGQKRLNDLYKDWKLTWLSPIGFDNQHELVMLKEKAERFDIVTMTDLADKSDGFLFAANREYFIRESTFPRLERLGLRFRDVREADIGDRYSGLFKNEFDVGVGWTTDPQMTETRLHRIEYDRQFPAIAQYAMPLCRTDVVSYVKNALSKLRIDETEMRRLNRRAQRAFNTPLAIRGIAVEFCKKLI
ncbi:MAG: glycine betaine ABC transporter substrate-binding protein [Candidatus Hodarchaeota archaeon]